MWNLYMYRDGTQMLFYIYVDIIEKIEFSESKLKSVTSWPSFMFLSVTLMFFCDSSIPTENYSLIIIMCCTCGFNF